MSIKGWLGKAGKPGSRSLGDDFTIQDLVTLGHHDEAETRLVAAIKKDKRDLRSRRMLADLYIALGRQQEAVEEYSQVVAAFARDGFHDQALALLAKVRKLVPSEDRTIGQRIEEVLASKRSEHLRLQVREIFSDDQARRGTARGALALEVDRCWQSLARWSVLDKLEGDQIRRLFSGFQLLRFKSGEWIVRKGGELERLMVILDGEVEVLIGKEEESLIVVHAFAPGESIGEGALVERRPWPGHYRAKGVTSVLGLGRSGLEKAVIGNSAPKALLDALRSEGNDRKVSELLQAIGKE